MNNKKLVRLRDDFLSWEYNQFDLCKKHNISIHELHKLEKKPSFRKVIRNWINYKRCKNCDVWKEVDKDFTIAQYNNWIPTYRTDCKICRNLKIRNRKILNPSLKKKDTEYKKRRREKHPEKSKEISDRYRRKHYDKILKRDRLRQRKKTEANRQLLLKQKRLW